MPKSAPLKAQSNEPSRELGALCRHDPNATRCTEMPPRPILRMIDRFHLRQPCRGGRVALSRWSLEVVLVRRQARLPSEGFGPGHSASAPWAGSCASYARLHLDHCCGLSYWAPSTASPSRYATLPMPDAPPGASEATQEYHVHRAIVCLYAVRVLRYGLPRRLHS